MLAAGHFVIDMTVGALPAFLPLFTALYALSDFQAAMILAASLVASSVTQPLFGLLADRRAAPWFLVGGVAVAAAGLAAAGLAAGYAGVLAAIVGSGLGVAAYHPEAARVANLISDDRPSTGVAWFMVGGHLGFAAGPLMAGLLIPVLGAEATLAFLIPGAAVAGLLLVTRRRVSVPVTPPARGRPGAGRSHVPGLVLLICATTMRTWTMFGLLALVPLYLEQQRGFGDRGIGVVLFLFALGGAAGTVVGAWLADRLGGKHMLVWSLPLVSPLIAGFIVLDGPLGLVSLVGAGVVLLSSFSVTVVMGQAYLPDRIALAAGLMIGFAAIGSAAPGLALIGAIADILGREAALWTVAALPIVGALMAIPLPQPRGPSETEAGAAV
jgi:MFS transporter, FSR family, fosmidomycin resistance protein